MYRILLDLETLPYGANQLLVTHSSSGCYVLSNKLYIYETEIHVSVITEEFYLELIAKMLSVFYFSSMCFLC